MENLGVEGITEGVELVGDVMYDCALYYADKAKGLEPEILSRHGLDPKAYYLATVHRAENTDNRERLADIVQAFNELSLEGHPVVIPLHPRTRNRMAEYELAFDPAVRVIPPISYLEMVVLEKEARALLTDSGGVQKEAFFYRVPCVTLREETEWLETVASGWNRLVGCDPGRILLAIHQNPIVSASQVPPDGMAAQRILARLWH